MPSTPSFATTSATIASATTISATTVSATTASAATVSSSTGPVLTGSTANEIAASVSSAFRRLRQPVLGRRSFLKISGVMGGGFTLAAAGLPSAAEAADLEGEAGQFMLNAFVHIAPSGAITLYSHTPEMGQGVKTSIPMVIAEELGAAWSDVTVVQSPVNEAVYGEHFSGGSRSTNRTWQPMREIGAAARHMFIAAAADQWRVDAAECFTENSVVIHEPSRRKLSFAQLAIKAAQQATPEKNKLTFKDRKNYTLLGTRVSGVDNIAIATGKSLFATDLQLPNMLYAIYQKCPAFYGKVKTANVEKIKTLPGIVDAFVLNGADDANGLLPGVAIVAKSTWQAIQAKQQLRVEWDESHASTDSWTQMGEQAKQLAKTIGAQEIVHNGNVESAFTQHTENTLESYYTYPYVAHACMEPMNCTAHYRKAVNGKPATLEVWAPTQAPDRIYGMAKNLLDVDKSQVTIHQMRMGGAFGRRGRIDFSSEAAAISHRVDAPVKLVWTREDDMQHDFYRAGGFYSMKGALDNSGKMIALDNHLVGPGYQNSPVTGTRQLPAEFPADCLPNYRGTLSLLDSKTPCGPWRAPGSNVTAWAVQSFIAEMAHKAGRDHLEFLLEIMGEPRWFEPGNMRSLNTGRASDVIKLAAEKAGWGKTLPAGHGMGLAFHFSHAAHVAEVVEVSVDANKKLTVHKVTAAVDIGPVINRSGAESQVEGSIVDGLSTMLGLEITMEKGRVQQSNFHDYRPLRIPHTPIIETHFIESDNASTGIGEPGLPPLAPAIGNAIFAATGERVRTMPISKEGYHV